MKKYLAFALLCFLVLPFLDWRASYCGQGMLNVTLPGGITPDWFNCHIRLNDSEGWGVFYPGITIEKNGLSAEKINSINGYGFNMDRVYVRYFSNKKIKSVEITNNSQRSYFTINSIKPDEIPYTDIDWVNTEASSCFWGRWYFFRAIIIFLALWFFWKFVACWRLPA